MIKSGLCNSAKREFLEGKHRPGHILKMALFIKGAPLDKNTSKFGPDLVPFEVTGLGYGQGGKALHGISFGVDENTAFMTFENVIWPVSSIKARGCLIYNDSLPGRPTIAVYNFGRDIVSDRGDFTVAVPKANSKTAIIRLG